MTNFDSLCWKDLHKGFIRESRIDVIENGYCDWYETEKICSYICCQGKEIGQHFHLCDNILINQINHWIFHSYRYDEINIEMKK